MTIFFKPLQSPILDPRNERQLVEQAKLEVFNASGGVLNDFSATSPVSALIEGQAFSGAELLYFINKLPEATAIAFLTIAGIQQRLGIASKVFLTFSISAVRSASTVIPGGYVAKTASGVSFATDSNLSIPPGNITGSVSATCQSVGTIGNVAKDKIYQLTQPLAFLQSVTNLQAATGGVRDETLDEVKARAFAALRRRGLVSVDDYNQEIQAFLGNGSVAFAVPNLNADKVTFRRGTVHSFVLNADGTLLNPAQLTELEVLIQSRSHVSIFSYISNVDLQYLNVYAVVQAVSGTNPDIVGADINAKLREYLSPGKLKLGASIVLKELEYLVRLGNVSYVQSVTIGFAPDGVQPLPRVATNLDLPFSYSVVKLRDLTIEFVNGDRSDIRRYGL